MGLLATIFEFLSDPSTKKQMNNFRGIEVFMITTMPCPF